MQLNSYNAQLLLLMVCIFVSIYMNYLLNIEDWLIAVFLLHGVLICIFVSINYFQMNNIGVHGMQAALQQNISACILNSVNVYIMYIVMMIIVSSLLYFSSKESLRRPWYFVCLWISFFAIVSLNEQNAFIALIVFFAVIPLRLFRQNNGILEYNYIMITFMLITALVDMWRLKSISQVTDKFIDIVNTRVLLFVVFVFWFVAGGITLWKRSYIGLYLHSKQIPHHLWCGFLVISLIVLLISIYDINITRKGKQYGAFQSCILFDNRWSISQGYSWRKSADIFQTLSPTGKLIGYSPDLLGLLTINFYNEMLYVTGQYYNNAYNACLQFLLSIGLLGVFFSLQLNFATLAIPTMRWKKQPCIKTWGLAIACCFFRRIVNAKMPIAKRQQLIMSYCTISCLKSTMVLKYDMDFDEAKGKPFAFCFLF